MVKSAHLEGRLMRSERSLSRSWRRLSHRPNPRHQVRSPSANRPASAYGLSSPPAGGIQRA